MNHSWLVDLETLPLLSLPPERKEVAFNDLMNLFGHRQDDSILFPFCSLFPKISGCLLHIEKWRSISNWVVKKLGNDCQLI